MEAFTDTAEEFITALIYGAAGSGKTTLASTFPKPILFLDFDGKMGTIPKDKREGIFREDLVFENPQKAPAKFEKFRSLWNKAKKSSFTLPDGSKPATIVLDSATLFDMMNIYHFMQINGKDLQNDKPTLPIYGDQSHYYSSFFAGINSFPCNLVMIFHEFYREDDKGMVEGIQPLITGRKMLNKVPAIFQEVWWLSNSAKGRILHYKSKRGAVANSISLKGNGEILDPTYEKIQKERV